MAEAWQDMTLEEFWDEWDACVVDTDEPSPEPRVQEVPNVEVEDEVEEPTEEWYHKDLVYEAAVREGLEMMRQHGPSLKAQVTEKKKKSEAKKRAEERQKLFERLGGSILYHPKGAVYKRT